MPAIRRSSRRRCHNVPSPLVGEGQGGGDCRTSRLADCRTSKVGSPPTPSPSPQGGGESGRSRGEEGGLILCAVAQARGNAVDREVDALHHGLVAVAATVALQQLQLHVVERVEVGEAVAYRAGEQLVVLQQSLVLHDLEQGVDGILPFGAQARE